MEAEASKALILVIFLLLTLRLGLMVHRRSRARQPINVWMLPILIALLVCWLLIMLGGSSPLSPFIYTLF